MPENWLTFSWQALVVRGAVGIVFGIVAIAAPVTTALGFALLWGIWAIADGIGSLGQAFAPGSGSGSRALHAVMGVVALLAGVFAVTSPAMTAVTLTWILGVWFVVRGAFELAGASSSSATTPRGLLLATGVLDVAIGLLFAANPGRSAVGIAVVLGLVALVWGIAFVAVGLVVRRQSGDAPAATAPPGGPVPPAAAAT